VDTVTQCSRALPRRLVLISADTTPSLAAASHETTYSVRFSI
jgi:hypothetical protein